MEHIIELNNRLSGYYNSACSGTKVIFAIKMLIDILKDVDSSWKTKAHVIIDGALSYTCLWGIMEVLDFVESVFKN